MDIKDIFVYWVCLCLIVVFYITQIMAVVEVNKRYKLNRLNKLLIIVPFFGLFIIVFIEFIFDILPKFIQFLKDF